MKSTNQEAPFEEGGHIFTSEWFLLFEPADWPRSHFYQRHPTSDLGVGLG